MSRHVLQPNGGALRIAKLPKSFALLGPLQLRRPLQSLRLRLRRQAQLEPRSFALLLNKPQPPLLLHAPLLDEEQLERVIRRLVAVLLRLRFAPVHELMILLDLRCRVVHLALLLPTGRDLAQPLALALYATAGGLHSCLTGQFKETSVWHCVPQCVGAKMEVGVSFRNAREAVLGGMRAPHVY